MASALSGSADGAPSRRGVRGGSHARSKGGGISFRHGATLLQGLTVEDAERLVEKFAVATSPPPLKQQQLHPQLDGHTSDIDARKTAIVRDVAFKIIEDVAQATGRQFSGVWQAAAQLDFTSDPKLRNILRDINSAAAVLHHVNSTWGSDVCSRVGKLCFGTHTGQLTHEVSVDGTTLSTMSQAWSSGDDSDGCSVAVAMESRSCCGEELEPDGLSLWLAESQLDADATAEGAVAELAATTTERCSTVLNFEKEEAAFVALSSVAEQTCNEAEGFDAAAAALNSEAMPTSNGAGETGQTLFEEAEAEGFDAAFVALSSVAEQSSALADVKRAGCVPRPPPWADEDGDHIQPVIQAELTVAELIEKLAPNVIVVVKEFAASLGEDSRTLGTYKPAFSLVRGAFEQLDQAPELGEKQVTNAIWLLGFVDAKDIALLRAEFPVLVGACKNGMKKGKRRRR